MGLEIMLTNRQRYRDRFDKAGWVMPMCSLDGDFHLSDSLSDFVDFVVKFRIKFLEYDVSGHPEWA